MLCAPCSGLVLLLILSGTNGDSVTQTEGPVILPEGALLTLNCTYQSSYSVFLFWYVQYQNKEPELLLKSSSENQEEDSRGFQAKLVTSDSSFHLRKASVQVSDSAVYYCALRDTVRGTIGGAEHKPRGCRWAWLWQPWEGCYLLSSVLRWRLPQSASSSDASEPRSLGILG
uniref:Ig-like domain-containing protein n=1 Tax=Equus caballus TaxID=9796 RepID=A0A3Q2LL12_HORSE